MTEKSVGQNSECRMDQNIYIGDFGYNKGVMSYLSENKFQ